MYTVIVKYRLPVPVERAVMLEEFRAAEASFQSVPGLVRKYFCYDGPSHTGHSVYLWDSEAQARAFFGPRFARTMVEKFDAVPEITFLDTLLIVDNALGEVLANPG